MGRLKGYSCQSTQAASPEVLVKDGDWGALTGEVVTANVVDIGILNQAPDLGLLEVVQIVVVRGAQIRAHAPVVAGDDHAATAGRLRRLDAVLDAQAGLLDGVLEDGGVLVVANAAQVHDAVVGQQVLGAAGGVLGGAAGDQLRLVVVQEVLVEALVLVLGQDGVVGLEAVLGEQVIVANGLDVWYGGRLVASFTLFYPVSFLGEGGVEGPDGGFYDIPRRGFSRQRSEYCLEAAIVSNW